LSRNRCKTTHTHLLGFGLDNKDGHVRITKGEDFHLMGGSDKTHRKMQDKVMELSEDLAKKGKAISDIGPEDYERVSDILKD
jgi:hypothetical protein